MELTLIRDTKGKWYWFAIVSGMSDCQGQFKTPAQAERAAWKWFYSDETRKWLKTKGK
jgi:hypothetical protein